MQLLNTYEDQEIAEIAQSKLVGDKRLASERDGTETIYNLFGTASWRNFYALEMFNLKELELIISLRKEGREYDSKRHLEILSMLSYVSRQFNIEIPAHWF
ncbi:hypothetical protein [Shewanella putrefaciens]